MKIQIIIKQVISKTRHTNIKSTKSFHVNEPCYSIAQAECILFSRSSRFLALKKFLKYSYEEIMMAHAGATFTTLGTRPETDIELHIIITMASVLFFNENTPSPPLTQPSV